MYMKMITFVDQIGRVVVGREVECCKGKKCNDCVKVENPVIIHVQPNPETGQLTVQSFPYLFMEFIDKDHRDTNIWKFNRSNIVISDVVLDAKIIEAYNNVNTPAADVPAADVPAPADTAGDNVVKMFDK